MKKDLFKDSHSFETRIERMHTLLLLVVSFIYLRPFSQLPLLKKISVWENAEHRPALKHGKTMTCPHSGLIIALSDHSSSTFPWSYKESGSDPCQPFTSSVKVSVTLYCSDLLGKGLDSSLVSSNSFEWVPSFN